MANHLIHEKSPYLLQHAHNPVDWYPWGEEALARARREDKPIFLSVGYSTCHWCHVMERESFEDAAIADLLNRWFVAVKVDREERPDVDRMYMNAAMAISGSAGWPLSAFLTPEGKPFFAGTYFPPVARYGRPGFPDVLESVHAAWVGRRADLEASADELARAIARAMQVVPDAGAPAVEVLVQAGSEQLADLFDARWGGFGRPPKFPQPAYLFLLLRQWARAGDAAARDMALATLRRMAMGGIHDHLGGGFHRYSTDAEWRVPHFEKMLYDQAQLACAYLEAYQAGGERGFADVARDVLEYVARDLAHPEGGFYSAEDADSPVPGGGAEEGAFYAWTAAEVATLVGPPRAPAFLAHYGITAEGNFEGGKNVLHAEHAVADTAARLGAPAGELEHELAEDRLLLLAARGERARPHLDDKVLAAWNGLMISAYARAHQVLGEARDLERARRAADFVWRRMYGDGRAAGLARRFRDGQAAGTGELSDYAALTQGLVDLYEAGFDVRDLERAEALADRMVELFWDEPGGGFFDTAAATGEGVLVRGKQAHDGAEPAGNSLAVAALARLAAITGRADLESRARGTLELFAAYAARSPLALAQMWTSADWLAGGPVQVVVAGRPDAPDTAELVAAARAAFVPGKVVLLADGGAGQEWLARRLDYLAAVAPVGGRAAAYLCEDRTCRPPVTSSQELARMLADRALHPTRP